MNCLLRNATHSHCNRDIFIRSNRGFLDNQRLGPVFTPIHSIPSIPSIISIYIPEWAHCQTQSKPESSSAKPPVARHPLQKHRCNSSAGFFRCVLELDFRMCTGHLIAEQNPKQTCWCFRMSYASEFVVCAEIKAKNTKTPTVYRWFQFILILFLCAV